MDEYKYVLKKIILVLFFRQKSRACDVLTEFDCTNSVGFSQLAGTNVNPARWTRKSDAGNLSQVVLLVTSPSVRRLGKTSNPWPVRSRKIWCPRKPSAPVTKTDFITNFSSQ